MRPWLLVAVASLFAVAGCATGWQQQGDRFVDEARGMSIAVPDSGGASGAWRPVDVDGSVLTLRREDGATLSWLRRCERREVSARTASRELVRGLPDRVLSAEGAVATEGGEAWRVAAQVGRGEAPLGLDAVTRVGGGCIDDWVLVAPAGSPTEGVLDAWWPTWSAMDVAAPGDER